MIIFDELDSFVSMIAAAAHKPDDHVRLIVTLMLQIPIGVFMNHFVKGITQRYLYSLMMGLFLQIYMFRSAVYHIYLIGFISYNLMNQLPRDS
jgi:hypothetical protein